MGFDSWVWWLPVAMWLLPVGCLWDVAVGCGARLLPAGCGLKWVPLALHQKVWRLCGLCELELLDCSGLVGS